jgi:hypothetical protein
VIKKRAPAPLPPPVEVCTPQIAQTQKVETKTDACTETERFVPLPELSSHIKSMPKYVMQEKLIIFLNSDKIFQQANQRKICHGEAQRRG